MAAQKPRALVADGGHDPGPAGFQRGVVRPERAEVRIVDFGPHMKEVGEEKQDIIARSDPHNPMARRLTGGIDQSDFRGQGWGTVPKVEQAKPEQVFQCSRIGSLAIGPLRLGRQRAIAPIQR